MSMPTATSPRPSRPARPAAPPLPPFESLDRTHHRMLELLRQFETLIARLDAQGLDAEARRSAAEIGAFFDGQARAHHAEEERRVFPSLLASGDAALVHHVQRLRQDHGWLEEDWRLLSPQLDLVAQGLNGSDIEMLRRALPVFAALLEEHIALEESLVYPEARRRLAALDAGSQARST